MIADLAFRLFVSAHEPMHRGADAERAGRRSWLGRACLLPLHAALIAMPILIVMYSWGEGRALRIALRDAVPALRRLFGHAGPSMSRARRSQSAESRSRAALALAAAARLDCALDLAHRVAARLLDVLGAVAPTFQPRLAAALVARSAAISRGVTLI